MDPTTQRLMSASASRGTRGINWVNKSPYVISYDGLKPEALMDVLAIPSLNTYLAVGDNRTILRSTDGITWTLITPPSGTTSSTTFRSIAYNTVTNQIVVCGDGGVIYSNDAGLTWTKATGASGTLNSVAYGNGVYIAVGGTTSFSTLIYRSTNGTTWTSATIPAITDAVNCVAYGDPLGVARWLAAGDNGRILQSADNGVTWTTSSAGGNTYLALTYAGGTIKRFTLTAYTSANVSVVYSSTNGTSVSLVATNPGGSTALFYGARYANNAIVLVGEANSAVTSSNGTTWTATNMNRGNNTLRAVTYDTSDSRYVMVGNDAQSGGVSAGARLQYSASMTLADIRVVYSSVAFYSVTYAQNIGTYVVGGDHGLVFTSTDLVTWEGKYLPNYVRFNAAFNGAGAIIIAGASFDLTTGYVYTSTDASNWTLAYTGTNSVPYCGVYAPGFASTSGITHILLGFNGDSLISPDGINWSPASAGTANTLRGITYTNIGGTPAVFAVGSSGTTSYSTDGVIWNVSTISGYSTMVFQGVTYSPSAGKYVAVGGTRSIGPTTALVTSPDRVNWTAETSGTSLPLYAAIQTPSGTTVVGGATNTSSAPRGYIITSTNTSTWTPRTQPANYETEIYNFTYAALKLVAVGLGSTVYLSTS